MRVLTCECLLPPPLGCSYEDGDDEHLDWKHLLPILVDPPPAGEDSLLVPPPFC